MLYQIADGTVSLGGTVILSHINFEIRGNEKIAVVGKNGAGKTTLLKLIAGELELDRDDRRQGTGIFKSFRVTVGMLKQQAFSDGSRTVEEEMVSCCPAGGSFERERFEYEREFNRLFTGFGFVMDDRKKRLREFSGGEQTKIALIRLLLMKPDILLLDEPTNHLDIPAAEWLEQYLKGYPHAVVMVSHDRFFLDRTVDVVYEVGRGKLSRFPGNYTEYRQEKLRRIARQRKEYGRAKEEAARLNRVIERFKNKPSKAAFARAKKKQLERMGHVEPPESDDVHLFAEAMEPLIPGSKWVLEAEHAGIGYDRTLLEVTLRVRRGQKIGILGDNGVGKTAFLKTVAGLIPPRRKGKKEGGASHESRFSLGNHITIGYFDQHSAEIESEKSVAQHFHDLFPSMSEKEVRTTLGAYLFSGREASKRVSDLSGGEKARLVLAEILHSRPNFLVLDEPTNHMDIQAKETLESAFRAYTGTILFVSHDRYFICQVADSVLIFDGHGVMYYPFGYAHYLERAGREDSEMSIAAQVSAEDAALIAGIRAVPKAERHRLKEIPEEEAYLDWKLRLAREKLEASGERYGELIRARNRLWEELWEWEAEHPASENGQGNERLAQINRECEESWEIWHEACLDWYENCKK